MASKQRPTQSRSQRILKRTAEGDARLFAPQPTGDRGQDELTAGSRFSRRTFVAGAFGAGMLASSHHSELQSALAHPAAGATLLPVLPAQATPEPVPIDPSDLDALIGELAAAGIAVYADANALAPLVPVQEPGPLALLQSQLQAMALEVSNKSGVLGSDLDALVLAQDEHLAEQGADEEVSVVPPSQLLTAYLATTDSPGAKLARQLMPVPQLDQASDAIYPGLVQTLFAADLARDNLEAAGITAAGMSPMPQDSAFAKPRSFNATAMFPNAQGGVCSAVQGFIDNMLNKLFGALHVNLGDSIPGRILSGIIDFLLSNAERAIRAVLRQLTAPVLNIIKTVAGVIGTVSTIVSTLRPWSLRMTPTPMSTRLAIGSEPPIPGEVGCLVDLGGLDEWPVDIADCAAQSGAPLPPLKPAGARCSWTIEQPRPLIEVSNQPSALDGQGAATLPYVTGVEDAKTAKGTALVGQVRVTLTIVRPEMGELQQTVANLIFAQLPAIVAQFVQPILGPVVDGLLGKLRALTDTRSSTTIPVVYHERDPDEPTPEPEVGAAMISVAFLAVGTKDIFPYECEDPDDPYCESGTIQSYLELQAGTCDGDAWSGTLREVDHMTAVTVDGDNSWQNDTDQTLPISWSFSAGDTVTITIGPFEGLHVGDDSLGGHFEMVLSTTYDVTIQRMRTEDGQTTLTFGIAYHGQGSPYPILVSPQEANLGVPIPTSPGNETCTE